MQFNIIVLPGDGVGPEVVDEGVRVLEAVGKKFKHKFVLDYYDIGGVAIDKHGVSLRKDTIKACKKADAVLLGAVGGPKWDNPLASVRPEDGLLALRKELGLFANLRPVRVLPMLEDGSTIKPEVVRGVDLVVVRELTGGLYFGKPKKRWQTSGGRKAVDTMAYSELEISRILKVGFELARGRRKKLASVDKANVLETSRLWRQIATEMAPEYPDVELQHVLVDSCAMRLIQRPAEFDVIVTENTFGDILTDEASMLPGSMGMLPSASVAGIPEEGHPILGLYEPIHGSAPRRAGLNMANPIATILSVALMLRYSLALYEEAAAIEKSVTLVLENGFRTYDIARSGKTEVGTKQMGGLIAEAVLKN
ncbi:MAG: 3-isopropylmalate dehydrogenase [Dehalococcoidia bacterium]|nr:3-isopropylmalate dehydrogenase [Dehalococcoidia bacterium]